MVRHMFESPPSGLTRRQLLVRSGSAYILLAGTLGARARGAEAAPADGIALSATRQATYVAVLGAVAADPGTGLGGAHVAATGDQFAGYYAQATGSFRDYADVTLDQLESEAGFAALDGATARSALREWTAAGPRQGLAASALTLASLTFEEDELRQVGYVLEPA